MEAWYFLLFFPPLFPSFLFSFLLSSAAGLTQGLIENKAFFPIFIYVGGESDLFEKKRYKTDFLRQISYIAFILIQNERFI